jgi:BRO family, N-terminal domain protein
VEVKGEWWAVLKDVCDALDLNTKWVKQRLEDEVVSNNHIKDSLDRRQEMLIVNEYGIYDTVFQSRKKEAKEFRHWVYEVIKELREAAGYKGFEVFALLDKEHQKEAMRKLRDSLRKPVKVDFIKANTIANKAVSLKYGYPKMLKKADMNPVMLADREGLLDDTVELMSVNEKHGLGLSVSKEIYKHIQH